MGSGVGRARIRRDKLDAIRPPGGREYLIPNENLMINQVENWSYSSRNVRSRTRVASASGFPAIHPDEISRINFS